MPYDPFAPDSSAPPAGVVSIAIERSPPDLKAPHAGSGLTATYAYVDATGVERWKRAYAVTYSTRRTATRTCELAISGAAIEIATEFTIFNPPVPAPAPAPAPPPAPAPKPPEPPSRSEIPPDDLPPAPPAPPKPHQAPYVFRIGAAARLDDATVPGLVPGFTLSAGARRAWGSAAFQFHWDPPASLALAYGNKASVAQLAGGVLLCRHIEKWFVLCMLGEASAIQVIGNFQAAATATFLHGAVGGKVAADIPIPRLPIFVEPALDLGGAFGPSVSYLSNVITLPRLNAGLGLAVIIELDAP